MGWVLFLAFVSVPIAEIALFIEIGGRIGLWYTIAAVVVTAAAGAALVRRQGLETLGRARQAAAENRTPVAEVVEGAFLLFAGALLLTPGFLTDALGFALLLPGPRRAAARALIRRLAVRAAGSGNGPGGGLGGGFEGGLGGGFGDGSGARPVAGVVIEENAPEK